LYFGKFENFARIIRDHYAIGIALNRQGINAYRLKDYAKALSFHMGYLDMLSEDYSFVTNYNVGVCLRHLGRYKEAIQYFEQSKHWAEIWHVR